MVTLGILEYITLHSSCAASWDVRVNNSGIYRVGHRVLLRSERMVLALSFKERNILLRSFLKFLATYETQKNNAFFCVLFLSTLKNAKNAKNATFFGKERKRTQRTQHSLAKNVIERKEHNVLMQKNAEHCVLLKRTHAKPSFFFFNIYTECTRYWHPLLKVVFDTFVFTLESWNFNSWLVQPSATFKHKQIACKHEHDCTGSTEMRYYLWRPSP